MNILVNASNLRMGGSLQVAHSFIHEIRHRKEINFHIVLSENLASQMNDQDFPENFHFYRYTMNPWQLAGWFGRNRYLDTLETAIHPDCVFTIFGPAYWTPRSRHVMGFADGWCYNPESVAFRRISYSLRFKRFFMIGFKRHRVLKEYDTLIVETEDARQKINRVLGIPLTDIRVVGNTFHEVYNQPVAEAYPIPDHNSEEFRMLTMSAGYPHKNLEIINPVSDNLRDKNLSFRFYVTLESRDYSRIFDSNPCVTNLGPVKVTSGPAIYSKMNALFLPTLLETFTSSYPEAMKMGIPILTSDISFAHDICQDAAEYFNPLDPNEIAKKIEGVMLNPERRDTLVQKGRERLLRLETAAGRAAKFLDICLNL